MGTSYLRHARHWIRWVFETPTGENPLVDPANCDSADRPGPVQFLPPPTDTGQTTTCSVTSTDALVVTPAGNLSWPEPGEPSDRPTLLANATAGLADVDHMTVSVDGTRVRNLRRDFRFRDVIGSQVPADNPFELPAGQRPLAFDGYFVVLRPLPPGHHEIVLSVSFHSDGSTWDLTTDLEVTE